MVLAKQPKLGYVMSLSLTLLNNASELSQNTLKQNTSAGISFFDDFWYNDKYCFKEQNHPLTILVS